MAASGRQMASMSQTVLIEVLLVLATHAIAWSGAGGPMACRIMENPWPMSKSASIRRGCDLSACRGDAWNCLPELRRRHPDAGLERPVERADRAIADAERDGQ